MAKSWLELQNNLTSGASTFPLPKPNIGCGFSFSTVSPSSNTLNLPDPTDATTSITDFLNSTQAAIDSLGADVMQVLQDIGAFIPPGLFSGSSSGAEDSAAEGKAEFASVNNYNTTTSAGGNIAETTGYDDQTGDSFWQLRTSSGSGLTLDTDGSFYIVTAKNPPEDPDTGKFGVVAAGPTVFKLNEFLAIEVNNDNKITGENGPAFSLIINGPTDIVVRNGDMKIRGTDNVLIEAGKSLELKGSDIKIHAGSGTGEEAKDGKPPEDEQGGTVEIKAAMFKNSSVSQQNVEGATFNKVTGEKAFIMDDPQATFSIQSEGSLELRCKGDMVEDIGGRRITKLLTQNPAASIAGGIPPVPLIKNQSAAWYITNVQSITPSGSGSSDPIPPLMEIESSSSGGGFSVNAGGGNITLSTTTGNFAMVSDNACLAYVVTPNKSATAPKLLKGLKAGYYVGGRGTSLRMFSESEVSLGLSATPPSAKFVDKYITVSTEKTEVIDKSGGIYLN